MCPKCGAVTERDEICDSCWRKIERARLDKMIVAIHEKLAELERQEITEMQRWADEDWRDLKATEESVRPSL